MTPDEFRRQVSAVTAEVAGRPLDASLQHWLNAHHGAGSASFEALARSCRTGVADGWLCDREGGGIRYGRIFKPSADLHGFSVDVVDMTDVVGPHHSHPNGEVDLVMPIDGHPGQLVPQPLGLAARLGGLARRHREGGGLEPGGGQGG